MGAIQGLVHADGRPVTAREIARVRMRANIGAGWGESAWAYHGAMPRAHDMASWLPAVRSPDAEINFSRDLVVARARDLYRNDPWARGSIQRIADAAVGAHFFPVPQPGWRVLQRKLGPTYDRTWAKEFTSVALAEWRMWADDPAHWCDAERSSTITQLLYQGLATKLVEGDVTAMLPWMVGRQGRGAARYATTVQMIDPDRLCNPNRAVDTRSIRGGVEIDDLQAPIAYHITEAHQYDWYNAAESVTWQRIPRETEWARRIFVHDFDKERAGQHRGNSIFISVISRLKDLHRYDDYTLAAALLRTVYGMFVTSPYDEAAVRDAMEAGFDSASGDSFPASMYQELRASHHAGGGAALNGVVLPVLAPGEKVDTVGNVAGAGENFDQFQSSFIRSVATATGQSAEEISNDFSKLNYSSFRGAMLQAWKTLIRRRHDFAWGFCAPIYDAWVEEFCAQNPDLLPAGFTHDDYVQHRAAFARAKWIGPGRGWVDPVKERQGEVLGLDAGFGTLEQTCAEISGEYYVDVLEGRKSELELFHELDIPLPQVYRPTNAEHDEEKPQPA
jgi:lambda family phage portal protein